MIRIGVDVGGTNTDAVLIDVGRRSEPDRGILARHKTNTTVDVSQGIETAVKAVIKGADATKISSLTIGTTAFVNAVVERDARKLQEVAVIRLCGPYTRQCPPFLDFPPDLRSLVQGHIGFVDGGFQIDGSEIKPISEKQLLAEADKIKKLGLKAVAVVGVFSALDAEGAHEERARAILSRELGPSVHVVCSREVGQVGILERENATILNASILSFARRTVAGFKRAMTRLHLGCPLFLTQNDGTLTGASMAAKLPIRTFASGPSNSMRGASFLAGLDTRPEKNRRACIVVDVGGTTTDVGVLLPSGFPRQAAAFIEVGGVRTNFAMPDVQSVGLGGGSVVRVEPNSGSVTVGPDSVGHNLVKEALVFGGSTLTTTDITVASGARKVGNPSLVEGKVASEVMVKAKHRMKVVMERIIDSMKTSPEDAIVLLVGGGAIIAPDQLVGVGEIITPPYFDVANAVGAAMAKVSGEIDTIELLEGRSLAEVVDALKVRAVGKAVAAGADPDHTDIAEITNLPVQYVTNQATRLIVKAVGELSNTRVAAVQVDEDIGEADGEEQDQLPKGHGASGVNGVNGVEEKLDLAKYRPVVTANGEWELSELDLEWIAEGCGILGTGGGGSTYPPLLEARDLLRQGHKIRIIDPTAAPQDAQILRCAFMGSPSVTLERLNGGNEMPTAIDALLKYLKIDDFYATASDEIGGGNGMVPLLTAAALGKPCLDVDFMGRAFPNLDQSLPSTYKIANADIPCVLADGVENVMVMSSASSARMIEHSLRAVCTVMGSSAAHIGPPLSRQQTLDYGVQRSVSQAWWLGRAVAICRAMNDLAAIPKAILGLQTGQCLFVGKIVGVQREVRRGFTWGEVTIAPLKESEQEVASADSPVSVNGYDEDDELLIPFQNEFIYAYLRKSKRVLVTVPDLITVLDTQSGSALGTPDLRYGLRVTVIALAADEKWTKHPTGLGNGGPGFFGLNIPYTPVGGDYREPTSVIAEFGP